MYRCSWKSRRRFRSARFLFTVKCYQVVFIWVLKRSRHENSTTVSRQLSAVNMVSVGWQRRQCAMWTINVPTAYKPVSHQPMMRLICGSRKSATLACPRRFLWPLHPMAPISLKTLRVQWYSSIHIVGRAIGGIAIVSRAVASVAIVSVRYRRKQRAGSALNYVLLTQCIPNLHTCRRTAQVCSARGASGARRRRP